MRSQARSKIPTTAEWDALLKAAPILDDESPDMRDVCEHYMRHRDEIVRASGGDDFFLPTDRENASKIDGQFNSYNVGGVLHGVYTIYGAGAPFERLFFETRQQLDATTRQLAYERKEREFEKKALDPRYDDYNFFEGYLQLQHAVNDYDNHMYKMRKEFSAKRRRERENAMAWMEDARAWEAAFRKSDRQVRKLGRLLQEGRRRETRWHRKYLEVVGDEFVGRPASV
jgi:hypothetical protein